VKLALGGFARGFDADCGVDPEILQLALAMEFGLDDPVVLFIDLVGVDGSPVRLRIDGAVLVRDELGDCDGVPEGAEG
jgi:hypothetical protein